MSRAHQSHRSSVNTFACSDVKIQMRPMCVGGVVVTRSPRMSDVRGSNPGTATGYALLMSSNKGETRVQCFPLAWNHRNNYARTGGRPFKREWCEYEQNTYPAKPQDEISRNPQMRLYYQQCGRRSPRDSVKFTFYSNSNWIDFDECSHLHNSLNFTGGSTGRTSQTVDFLASLINPTAAPDAFLISSKCDASLQSSRVQLCVDSPIAYGYGPAKLNVLHQTSSCSVSTIFKISRYLYRSDTPLISLLKILRKPTTGFAFLGVIRTKHGLIKDPSTVSTITRLIAKLESAGSVLDFPGKGRKPLSDERAPIVQNAVEQLQSQSIMASSSITQVSQLSGIPRASVHRIISRHLHLYPYHFTLLQNITEEDKEQRITFANWLLGNEEIVPNIL
ncbi:hypothetical protein CSKR_107457 [Clonorchis sinensis]|uniref:DUF4817 domain-containing protein n=1 Tax=Clonorchis sinensis TaxID=79923 RepID=A0A3R7DEA1_CLOSI|nr:hypothetical protein CSKR_107457 [Clonorchis sinensis]